ncbi:MAG TPA: ABC transporter permease subunit [Gaiellaceae bacterium]|nr:ABC transporter permease subunit [Gaiellaceae bacterium]
MSATAPTAPASGVRPPVAGIPRLISAFSGTTGYVVKIMLLSASNALSIWALYVLITRHHWVAVAVLALVTGLIDFVFMTPQRWSLPAKFLVPGIFLLCCFQVIPIIYTIDVAFTNYSTGHILTKAQAIKQIEITSLEAPANGRTYTMAIARDSSHHLVLILRDDVSHKLYVGTQKALTPLGPGIVTVSGGAITAAKGYTLLSGIALFNVDKQLQTFIVPLGAAGVRPQSTTTAVELQPTLRYEAKRDVFVRIADGAVYRDNKKGEFVHGSDVLLPGWKTGVGTANFSAIIHSQTVRSPFIRVFIWTFVFAAGTVFFSFAIGLFLAIALDKRGMRLQKLYRSILIIPWAVPGFLSLLVWGGLLNDQFGVVNRVFHLSVPWLFDANWARVSCILVSTWLTVPYFFVVSMGALQAIPEELVEAARVDGGGPLQIFRRVTLPLLLVAVGPLLIASFAFNFNNFNNIYLLTNGGPTFTNGGGIAGATDILISYTYKLAIGSGLGNNYGLASAITIIIFLVTAALSTAGFAKTRVLEEVL